MIVFLSVRTLTTVTLRTGHRGQIRCDYGESAGPQACPAAQYQ